MLLFLSFVVIVLVAIVFGSLHQMQQKDADMRTIAEDKRLVARELAKVSEQLSKATAPERERLLQDGDRAIELLSQVIWNEPWAHNEHGQVICFYCDAIARPDHIVDHRYDCRYIQSRNFLTERDAARGAK